jgi:hypothetical protein
MKKEATMPILDAAPLNREDEDVLRGVLGPATRPPIHAEQMRAVARRAHDIHAGSTEAGKRAAGLMNAIKNSDHAGEAWMRHLHPSA